MTPTAFTFKLHVPRDPSLAAVVTDVAAHAATYAGMAEPAAADFVAGVNEASAAELRNGTSPTCAIVLSSAGGELTADVGHRTVARKIAG